MDTACPFLSLTPIEKLLDFNRIIAYPAASGAHYFRSFAKEHYPQLVDKIIALGDADPKKWGKEYLGLRIHRPDELSSLKPDCILLTSVVYAEPIRRELEAKLGQTCPIIDVNQLDAYLSQLSSSTSALARKCETLEIDELSQQKLLEHPRWYLSLPFGQQRFVNGEKGAFTYHLLETIGLPEILSNKRVLDLGASDGFYSFECEARGAVRVVAADAPAWSVPGGYDRFLTAKRIYNSSVEAKKMSVEEFSPQKEDRFDVIMMLGLYYHLKDPFLAFRKCFEMTEDMLIITGRSVATKFQDPFSEEANEAPYMILSHVPTGKWLCNPTCLEQMLRSAGFSHVEFTYNLVPTASEIGSIAILARK